MQVKSVINRQNINQPVLVPNFTLITSGRPVPELPALVNLSCNERLREPVS
jgi:hypothetical protein